MKAFRLDEVNYVLVIKSQPGKNAVRLSMPKMYCLKRRHYF